MEFFREIKNKIKYQHILAIGFGILGFAYLLVLLVDLLNVFGLRGRPGTIVPFYWDRLFVEASLIELTQWSFITGIIITSTYMAKKLEYLEQVIERKFWILFTVTGILMLVEDAGNIRHFLFRDLLELHWKEINIAETIYFGILAAVPSYALIKYGRKIREERRTFLLLILGGLFYGMAVTISGPGHSFGVTILGEKGLEITGTIGGEELQKMYSESEQALIDAHGETVDDLAFRFTDHFIEESLELIGAIFLLASTVSYLEKVRKREN